MHAAIFTYGYRGDSCLVITRLCACKLQDSRSTRLVVVWCGGYPEYVTDWLLL